MNNTLSKVFIFAAGALVGSAVAWYVTKTKYQQIMDEEAESFRALLSRKETDQLAEGFDKTDPVITDAAKHLAEVAKKVTDLGYASEEDVEKEVDSVKPYVISPDEFGERDYFETETLLLYADNILTDDQDNPIEDVDNVVGLDSLNHFGEYEDDSVFVRNERFKTDYEILLEPRKYSDVIKSKPHLAEGK